VKFEQVGSPDTANIRYSLESVVRNGNLSWSLASELTLKKHHQILFLQKPIKIGHFEPKIATSINFQNFILQILSEIVILGLPLQ